MRERKAAQLNTRVPINGCDEDAYTKAVCGLTAGKTAEIEVTYPDNFEVETVRGKPGKVALNVLEIQRVTPASIDDERPDGIELAIAELGIGPLRECPEVTMRLGLEFVHVPGSTDGL